MNSFLAGNICAGCNNGWMSALEVQCKNLILDLAGGRRQLLDLCDKEALLLARWTAKTAFALHTSSNWRRVVPDDHIYKLDKDSYRLPDRVHVVGHTFNRGSKQFSWSQTTTWTIDAIDREPTDQELSVMEESGYKIAIRLGGLFLMIAHNPFTYARTCLWKYRHVPLYPRWSHPCSWVMGGRNWPNKAEVRFQAFVTFFGLNMLPEDKMSPVPVEYKSRRTVVLKKPNQD